MIGCDIFFVYLCFSPAYTQVELFVKSKKPRKPGVRGISGLGGVDVGIGVDPLTQGVAQLRTQAGALHTAQALAIVLADFLDRLGPVHHRQFTVTNRRATPAVITMVVLEVDHVVARIKVTFHPAMLSDLVVEQ